jgi:hypothetical protein
LSSVKFASQEAGLGEKIKAPLQGHAARMRTNVRDSDMLRRGASG